MNHGTCDDVLSFWLGSPAATGDQLLQKIQRWYQGSPELDSEIRNRFGDLIERALDGAHEDWSDTPRGRLALIIVLDQFARNVHRGSPRAHAGDDRAVRLSLRLWECGDGTALEPEEQLFAMMPLVHAEDLELQDRAVNLSDRLVRDAATDDLRAVWSLGATRTRHYRDIVRRFGRFPHRNRALGRTSTPEEIAYLREHDTTPIVVKV